MLHWIWQQIGLKLPKDWEMLQFSRNPDAGSCGFADRYRFRAELHWKKTPGEPDFDRMMRDYKSSLAANGWDDLDLLRIEGYPGLTGRRGDEVVSRFGLFDPASKRLVELVLIHPGEREREVEKQILSSLHWEAANAQGLQRWRAFGMEMRVPLDATLHECVVQPGSVGIRFDGVKRPERFVFRRFGMVSHWLHVPVREWMKVQVGRRVKQQQATSTVEHGTAHERIAGLYHPEGALQRRGLFRSTAWIDPTDKRLYHALCTFHKAPPYAYPTDRADPFLTACPEFQVLPVQG